MDGSVERENGGRELTIEELVRLPGLRLRLVAGAASGKRRVSWLHVSELDDPTPWLAGGEVLLTSGLGVGQSDADRRAYVARLARHGVAGLGVGLGVVFDAVPPEIVEEAERLDFPTIEVPASTPFVAITRAAHTVLTSARLASMTRAIELHEELADALVAGAGLEALLGITSERLGCGLAVIADGGVLAEWHWQDRPLAADVVELPLQAGAAVLRVTAEQSLDDPMLLALAQARTVLSLELARRDAISATELRLAGDLLDDLEHERLDESEVSRRLTAFGLDPEKTFSAILLTTGERPTPEMVRLEVSRRLQRLRVASLGVARKGSVSFLVGIEDGDTITRLVHDLVRTGTVARGGIGRPARGPAVGRSMIEARTALAALPGEVVSYRDLGPVELLLAQPDAALQAFVQRVLSSVADDRNLVDSLDALFSAGWVWSEAARRLGVHRHTLRNRIERVKFHANSDPDRPEQRMELWLALKALAALEARGRQRAAEPTG